jgi:DNA-binding transcriptional MerR regulator
MNKTIKELSAEIGVSEQALRQWCRSHGVRKERTQGTKPSYIIDFDTEKSMKEYYSKETAERKAENNETKEKEKKGNSFDADLLLETFTKQLEVKDKQIEALTEQNNSLLKQLENITAALQAAQALHGMEKKQKVIETEQAAPEGDQSEPPQKTSLFSRLFRRK